MFLAEKVIYENLLSEIIPIKKKQISFLKFNENGIIELVTIKKKDLVDFLKGFSVTINAKIIFYFIDNDNKLAKFNFDSLMFDSDTTNALMMTKTNLLEHLTDKNNLIRCAAKDWHQMCKY